MQMGKVSAAALVSAVALTVSTAKASNAVVPESFDVRQEWFGCGLAVLNQGQCGSCWAVSATGVFGERMCIWNQENGAAIPSNDGMFSGGNRLFQKAGACTGEGTQKAAHNHGCKRTAQFLSPQPLLSCGTADEDSTLYPDSAGCNGGEALDAWRYFFLHGVSTMTADGAAGCTPYTAGRCAAKDPLNNGCKKCANLLDECEDSGLKPKVYKVGSFGWIMEEGLEKRAYTGEPRPAAELPLMAKQVEKMQVELMTNGPLHVCIDYFENFGGFFNGNPLGVYNSTEQGPKTGGHCLEIIGWGTDRVSGLPYWTIKNSWGGEWGSEGNFRMLRGVDLCGVESDVWAACPEGTNCKLTDGVYRMEHTQSKEHAVVEQRYAELLLMTGDEEFALQRRSLRSTSPLRQPSQQWRGGYWHELSRKDFEKKPFSLRIAHAYEKAFGEPTTVNIATAAAKKVFTQAVGNGLKVKVQFYAPKSTQGHLEALHLHSHDGKVHQL